MWLGVSLILMLVLGRLRYFISDWLIGVLLGSLNRFDVLLFRFSFLVEYSMLLEVMLCSCVGLIFSLLICVLIIVSGVISLVCVFGVL